ncbi:hypothetical protein M569_01359 [Genlisea aurea]|uniref:RING-type domain-containing protein n=1 Tax=Genlisea aurea TaxID=192259 RepID=S8D213_9LAMI|nr:hypothetical protein M569_01359 [Genlisea aurea]
MRFPELYSNPPSTGFYDESRLDTAAREAKRRLDQRLQVQPQSRSYNNGGWRQLSNVGSSWNSSEQDSCAVCLEQFDGYGALMQLPCGHRFHAHCLRPWLDTNADCPCCRMKFG